MKKTLYKAGAAITILAAAFFVASSGSADGLTNSKAAVTFNKDVASILFKNCAEWRRPGEAAPMSLLSYKEARPWARSIRDKVLSREMPSRHADPHVGQFSNDPRLTQAEIDTITAWVDGGAREKETKGPTAETQTAKPKSAGASRFVGTWKLVAFEGRLAPKRDWAGLLIYDATGHMAAQLLPLDRPKFASGNRLQGTQEEIKAAFDGYVAYFGPYEVNEAEGVVIHHVIGSIFPNDVGRDNVRYYEFSSDRLILIPTNIVDGKLTPKSSATVRLTWERVK